MKKIEAFIKPDMLQDVIHALAEIKELSGYSVFEVRGHGRGRGKNDTGDYLEREDLEGFIRHTKIELFCVDQIASHIVQLIQQKAHTGRRGDGKVYLSSIEHAIRIGTNDSGDSAV